MTPEQVSRELRLVAEKRRGEATPTFGIRISDMADAAADAIDQLLAIIEGSIVVSIDAIDMIQAVMDLENKPVIQSSGPCIHCNGGRALIIDDENDRGIAIQHPNRLLAFGYDPNGPSSNGVSCIIEYCPMCGVKIGGAA